MSQFKIKMLLTYLEGHYATVYWFLGRRKFHPDSVISVNDTSCKARLLPAIKKIHYGPASIIVTRLNAQMEALNDR